MLETLLPYFAIDKVFAVDKFREMLVRNIAVIGYFGTWEILGCDYKEAPDFYFDKLVVASESSDDHLKESAASMICALAIYESDSAAKDWIMRTGHDKNQQNAMCRQAVSSLSNKDFHSCSIEVLRHLINHATSCLDEFTQIFRGKEKINLREDKDFIFSLMSSLQGENDRLIYWFLKYANSSKWDLPEYVPMLNILSVPMGKFLMNGSNQYIVEEFVKYIHRMISCSVDNENINICLGALDMVYKCSLMNNSTLSKLIEKYNGSWIT